MTSKLGSGKFAKGGIGLGSLKFCDGYSALLADVHGGSENNEHKMVLPGFHVLLLHSPLPSVPLI